MTFSFDSIRRWPVVSLNTKRFKVSQIRPSRGRGRAAFRGGKRPTASGVAAGTQLIDFDDASVVFHRNNSNGGGFEGSYRDSVNSFVDISTEDIRLEVFGGNSRYLFEAEKRNFVSRTDNMNLGYTKVSVTVTDAQHNAPDGTLSTAGNFAFSASANARVYQTITSSVLPTDTEVTLSVWARRISGGTQIRLRFRGYDNVLQDGPDITLTDEWQRFDAVFNTMSGGTSPQAMVSNASSGIAIDAALYRFQVEIGRYPTSGRVSVGSAREWRYRDTLLVQSSEVPEVLRSGRWKCDVRPEWANDDLLDGDRRVICSNDSDNWIGFEKDSGSLYLRCYTGGPLRFGSSAITVARDTDYEVDVDLSTGVARFDGVAGPTGTATELLAGAPLRWGGMMGGEDELDGGCSEPVSA